MGQLESGDDESGQEKNSPAYLSLFKLAWRNRSSCVTLRHLLREQRDVVVEKTAVVYLDVLEATNERAIE